MNYRHAFHAGNFADVVKHAVLALVIEHLKLKPAPFRVIDTHAGAGLYDLASDEATRTGEWRAGIGRLIGPEAAPLPDEVERILRPYLGVLERVGAGAPTNLYPGSPRLALELMRAGDRLIANELHPEDRAQLEVVLRGDRRAKVLGIDGWQALRAMLPPKERRGVVLIDPPFEEAGELERLTQGLAAAVDRFATGTYLLWYPIKNTGAVAAFKRRLAQAGYDKLMTVELRVGASGVGLEAAGLIVLNPPFRLEAELAVLLPFLAERLATGPGATSSVGWLASHP
jgi:23S rRNA (adenine2030-N6)-methyltransferase